MRFLPRISFGWMVALLIVAAGGWFFLKPEKKPIAQVVTVEQGQVQRVLALNGRIRAPERVQIMPKASGRLLDISKDDGDRIFAGEILGRVEANDLSAKLAQANSALQAETLRRAQAQRDLQRGQDLFKKGFVSTARLEALKLSVDASDKEIARLQGLVAEQQSKSNDALITAPFSGTILERGVDGGQTVDARTVVFEVIADGVRDIEAEADEIYSGDLKVGQVVKIAPAGLARQIFDGRVSFVAPDINTESGGRLVRVSSDQIQRLPTGLSADINIEIAAPVAALTVPRASVIDPRGATKVRRVDADGKVIEQPIEISDWPAERVIVSSGLSAGDEIILSPRSFAVGTDVETQRAATGQQGAK